MKVFRLWLIGLIILFPSVSTAKKKYDPYTLYDYMQIHCRQSCVDHELLMEEVFLASNQMKLDPKLLLAVVRVESSFKTKARNRSNVGLTQVNLRYHKPKFKGHYFDVGENIRVGSIILRDCLQKHRQDVRKSLRCYNGNGTAGYDVKVLRAYQEIGKLIF